MFASKTTAQLEIDGVIVQIRKLSFRQLAEASDIRQLAALKLTSAIGPEMMKAMQDKPQEGLVAPRKRAYSSYDKTSVLLSGIISWSANVKVNVGIEDLTEEASDKIFEAIIDLSIVHPLDESPKD